MGSWASKLDRAVDHFWQLCFLFISLIEMAFLTGAKMLFFVQDFHKRQDGRPCRQAGVPKCICFPRFPATTGSTQMSLTYVFMHIRG